MKRWTKKVMLRWVANVLSIGLLLSADCLGQVSYVGFNPNGGKLSDGNFGAKNGTAQMTTLTLTYGKGSYNTGMRAVRSKAGYSFNGFWTTASGGSQKIYDGDGKYVLGRSCRTTDGK